MKTKFPNSDILRAHCGEHGLFGPTSYRWNQYAYMSRRLALLSASILQIAHPLIGQAVGQTEFFRTQPLSRTLAIIKFLDAMTYGSADTCIKACENLWTVHSHIEIKTNKRTYLATEPKLLEWVWLTTIMMEMQFVPISIQLDKDYDVNAIYEEYKLIALACGILPKNIPNDLVSMEARYHYFMQHEIAVTDRARDVAYSVFQFPSGAMGELTSQQWSRQLQFMLGPFDYYCYLFAKALLPDKVRNELGVELTEAEHQRFKRWCKRLKWFNQRMPARLTKSAINQRAMAGELL